MGMFNFVSMLFAMIILHELGHLVVAKFFKVQCNTFSIGFGYRVIGFRFERDKEGKLHVYWRFFNFAPNNWRWYLKKNTEYRIAPFLLGGFVAMEGENESTGKITDLVNKPYWQKVAVSMAGVTVNFITGFIAIYIVTSSTTGLMTSFAVTTETIVFAVKAMIFGIVDLVTGNAQILTMSETASFMKEISWQIYLMFFGLFSIALGVFNLIPFPALDGSLPILWLIEKAGKYGRRLANALIKTGFIILMIAQVVLLYLWIFG